MIKYSVIIPHYNSIDKLTRLISTIPKRFDIEVIIVDDNSDLSNNSQLEELCQNHSLYYNTSLNKGAGSCRNIGVQHSQGSYILFADADDYFLNDAFLIIDEKIKANNNFDIVFFKPTSICDIEGVISDRHLYYSKLVDEYIYNDSQNIRFEFHPPWSKVYRTDFIKHNNIKFDEVIASNDVMFSLVSGHLAQVVLAFSEEIYCVTRGVNTLTVSFNDEILLSRLLVNINKVRYIKKNNINISKMSLIGFVKTYYKVLDINALNVLLKLYLDNSITFFPSSYLNYIKKPKSFFSRRKCSATDKKYK